MTKYEKLIELANRMGSTKLCLDSTMACRYRGVGLEQIEWNKKYNERLAEFMAELKTLTHDETCSECQGTGKFLTNDNQTFTCGKCGGKGVHLESS